MSLPGDADNVKNGGHSNLFSSWNHHAFEAFRKIFKSLMYMSFIALT
jgi:hypothetical protein